MRWTESTQLEYLQSVQGRKNKLQQTEERATDKEEEFRGRGVKTEEDKKEQHPVNRIY